MLKRSPLCSSLFTSAFALTALLSACAQDPLDQSYAGGALDEAQRLIGERGSYGFILHESPLVARVAPEGPLAIRTGPWHVAGDLAANAEGFFAPRTEQPIALPDGSASLAPEEVAILGVLDTRQGSGLGAPVDLGDGTRYDDGTFVHWSPGSGAPEPSSWSQLCPEGATCSETYLEGFTAKEVAASRARSDFGSLWALVAAPRANVSDAGRVCTLDVACYRRWAFAVLDGHMKNPETGGLWRDDDPGFQGYRGILDALGLERDGSQAPSTYGADHWIVGWMPLDRLRMSPRTSCAAGDLVTRTAIVPLTERTGVALRAELPVAGQCPEGSDELFALADGEIATVAAGAAVTAGADYDVAADGTCPDGAGDRVERDWIEVIKDGVSGYIAAFYQVPLACE